MDVGPFVIPDARTTELIEPRESPLNDPAPPPQATAVLRAAHRQQRQNVTDPQAVPDRRRIIAAIAEHADRPAPGSAAVALQGRNRIHEGQGLLRVVAIGSGQADRQRDALSITDQMSGRGDGMGSSGSIRSHNASGSSTAAINR